ncbi:MAG: bactofilin family protein [Wenzhouxiangella sp.]
MFNKRDNSPAEAESSPSDSAQRSSVDRPATAVPAARAAGAVIGPSIQIDGSLKGDEDLLIQGRVKGTVELKNNSVTIGESGQVTADIYAHTIAVEGRLDGKLVASERVMIRKTAQIKGTIIAPRVTLEDGARFNGSIDMDPETEALKKAFASPSNSAAGRVEKTAGPGPDPVDKPAAGAAVKTLL